MKFSNLSKNREKRFVTDWSRTCYLWVSKGKKVGKSKQWAVNGLTVSGTEKWILVHHWICEHFCCIFQTSLFQFCSLRPINRWTKGFYFSNDHDILKSLQKYRKTFCHWLDSNLLPWVRKGMKVGKPKQWAIHVLTIRGIEKVTIISVNTGTSLNMWALLSTVYFKLLSSTFAL